jgi:hypothetical protein
VHGSNAATLLHPLTLCDAPFEALVAVGMLVIDKQVSRGSRPLVT